jgi:hypothetical protein
MVVVLVLNGDGSGMVVFFEGWQLFFLRTSVMVLVRLFFTMFIRPNQAIQHRNVNNVFNYSFELVHELDLLDCCIQA